MKNFTITVGIPAYNEEENIQKLLLQIQTQRLDNAVIREILIVSDGSTDNTVKVIRATAGKNVRVLENQTRSGIAHSLNLICKQATGDVLIILNADISLPTNSVLNALSRPIVLKKADLVSCKISELPAITFLAEVLHVSMDMKKRMYAKINRGDNVFTCFGPCRAFSKRMYSALVFPASIGEDAYSYFFAKKHGFSYVYLPNVTIHYALPLTLEDHLGQSGRFFVSQRKMKHMFGSTVVSRSYRIPKQLFLMQGLRTFRAHPLHATAYLLILLYSRLASSFANRTKDVWDVAKSSKALVPEKI